MGTWSKLAPLMMRFFLLPSTLEGGSWEEETSASFQGNFSSSTLAANASKYPWERKRGGGKGKEDRRRRRLEDTKREMLIHGRRVSSSFVSYLNDPLTILLFWGASYSGYTPGLTDELKRNLRASSWLTYITIWIVRKLVYSGEDLSLFNCTLGGRVREGGLERTCAVFLRS